MPDFCKFQKRLNKKCQVVGQDDDLEAAVVTRLDQVSNSGDEGQARQSLDDGGLGHTQFEHLIKKDDLKGQQRCAVIGNGVIFVAILNKLNLPVKKYYLHS